MCVCCMLHQLLPKMLYGRKNDEYFGAISPTVLFQNLKRISKTLRKGRQEDSHEFLRNLMETLQNDVLKTEPTKLNFQ